MKKITSLLMAALMLAAMLSVFALPASAAEVLYVEEDTVISGEQTYFYLSVYGKRNADFTYTPCDLTIESGASVTCDEDFNINNGCTVTIKSGASVTCNSFSVECGSTVIIENGASVTCGELAVFSNSGAKSTVTVEPGAVLTVNGYISVYDILNLGGVLTGKGEIRANNNINLLTGGTVDLEITNDTDFYVKDFVTILQQYAPNAKYEQTADGTYRVTAHKHLYNGTCYCTEDSSDTVGGEGSTLSEGSLTIICTATALALGLGGGFFIGRKKKNPATANGADTDEE